MPTPTEIKALGIAQKIPEIETYIQTAIKQWMSVVVTQGKNWFGFDKAGLNAATSFLIYCLDELIVLAEQFVTSGPDKKATVLNAASQIYDILAKDTLPLVALPFAIGIKSFVINTLLSLVIDYVVSKYNNGNWGPMVKS